MSNKLVIILVGVLVVCLLGFGAMFYMMWSKINLMDKRNEDPEKIAVEKAVEEKKIGPIHSLTPFIVNLDDPKLRKYLRITMDFELVDAKSAEAVNQRLPQIRDSILTILPSKNYEEITTVQGKTALRLELLKTVNSIFAKEVVKNIYFTEFVIQ